jgi:hypothetical protein
MKSFYKMPREESDLLMLLAQKMLVLIDRYHIDILPSVRVALSKIAFESVIGQYDLHTMMLEVRALSRKIDELLEDRSAHDFREPKDELTMY